MGKTKRSFRMKVHPAGLLILALAFLFARSHAVLAVILALLLHEGAHMLVMLLCGVRRCTIELTPFGGMADAQSFERLKAWKQMAIAAAGVVSSAVAAMLCLALAPRTDFWYSFLNASFSLAIINCMPVWPLDGARIIMAVAMHYGVETVARRIMLYLAYALGIALALLGLYGAWLGYLNFSLLLVGPYLCYAAHESAISQNLKHMQRADRAKEKLMDGGIMPVRALAAASEPNPYELMRMMLKMPPHQFHLLYVVDEESGKVNKVMTEQEIAEKVFTS